MRYFVLILLLLAAPALAEQTTQERCEAILNSYVRLKVDVEQAGLALTVQRGIVDLCNRLIEAERPKPTPTPEAKR